MCRVLTSRVTVCCTIDIVRHENCFTRVVLEADAWLGDDLARHLLTMCILPRICSAYYSNCDQTKISVVV